MNVNVGNLKGKGGKGDTTCKQLIYTKPKNRQEAMLSNKTLDRGAYQFKGTFGSFQAMQAKFKLKC